MNPKKEAIMSDLPIIEAEQYRGHTIEIVPDDMAFHPRHDEDNVGIIAYKHREYDLGEETIGDPIAWLCEKLGKKIPAEKNDEKLQELEAEFLDKYHARPLYLFDHSGISISTISFSCRWDSGQIGWIYTTGKKLKEMGTPVDKAEDILEAEVEELDKFVRGDVYVVRVKDEDDNTLEVLGGIYDEGLKETFEEMRSIVDSELKKREDYANMC